MDEYTRALYGQNAVQVPVWMYVQNQGPDIVTIVGASRMPGTAAQHPLRFGSGRTHQLVQGEIIVRPRLVLGTDALRGMGLGGIATNGHDFGAMLADGEWVI